MLRAQIFFQYSAGKINHRNLTLKQTNKQLSIALKTKNPDTNNVLDVLIHTTGFSKICQRSLL